MKISKKIVNFLDVRFRLNEQTYEPYKKPNNEPVYINIQSNHPPRIKADIPNAISKGLTNISCNKNVFDRNVGIYQASLKNSGFDGKIIFNDQSDQANNVNIGEENQSRKCEHAIVWYNPPYSMNVKTNIGKTFFKLL